MKYVGRTDEFFEVIEKNPNDRLSHEFMDNQLSMIWFVEDDNEFVIDTKKYSFKANQIIFLTSFNKVEVLKAKTHRFLRFNSPFYCILNHDSEVGCKGVLFYGSKHLPLINPDDQETEVLETVWKMLTLEMQSNDNLQLEMLQMMLKRILILCTRIYKSQENFDEIDHQQVDIIREFNFLVESHFKEKHSVSDYAALLNKSPKTLSNLFSKLSDKSPMQYIHDRIMLEVRRLLRYTDQPISEVGYEVGFNDIQSFSRFFKKHQGMSPSDFRQT